MVEQYVFDYRRNVTNLFEYLQHRRRDDIDTRSLMCVHNQYRINSKEMIDLKNKIWNIYYGSNINVFQTCPMCKSSEYNKTDIISYQLNYIIPRSLGGLESRENLILLCSTCTKKMSEMEIIFDYEHKVYNRNNCEELWINKNIIVINRPLLFVDTTCIPIIGPMDIYMEQSRQEMRQNYSDWYRKERERKKLVNNGFVPIIKNDPFNEAFNELCLMLEKFHITTPSSSPELRMNMLIKNQY